MVRQITDDEYALLRDLVHRVSGISLARLKREIIVARLSRRLRELQIERFGDYYERALKDGFEAVELVNRLCTNTTQFFRESRQFDFLSQSVLPEVASEGRKLRVWSAGCSTGEEPYSIAMTVQEAVERHGGLGDVKILASDLSTRVLKKAEEGVYTDEEVSSVPPHFLKKYFLSGVGKYQGLYQVKQALSDLLIFRRINLIGGEYPIKGLFDMIFCRNVIIYFDRATQHSAIGSLIKFLKPGGYLFCGHSESLLGQRETLKLVSPCVYRKVAL